MNIVTNNPPLRGDFFIFLNYFKGYFYVTTIFFLLILFNVTKPNDLITLKLKEYWLSIQLFCNDESALKLYMYSCEPAK